MNIYLIGYRASGKTVVGKSLAKMLGWPFIDTDSELIAFLEMGISEFVQQNGWDAFRQNEKKIVRKAGSLDNHVVATGGGVVLDIQNVTSMQNTGLIVWLKATPRTVKCRLLQDPQSLSARPALTSKGLLEEIEEVLKSRNPLYQAAMHFSVQTDTLGIDEICKIITRQLSGAAAE